MEIENTEIGTEEFISLKPAIVRIESFRIEPIKNKDGKLVGDKVICKCKHPDSNEPLEISSVKYEKKKQMEFSGLWVTLDKSGKLQKGSALASFLAVKGVKTIKELIGVNSETVLDEKNYLCFKGY